MSGRAASGGALILQAQRVGGGVLDRSDFLGIDVCFVGTVVGAPFPDGVAAVIERNTTGGKLRFRLGLLVRWLRVRLRVFGHVAWAFHEHSCAHCLTDRGKVPTRGRLRCDADQRLVVYVQCGPERRHTWFYVLGAIHAHSAALPGDRFPVLWPGGSRAGVT